MSGSKKNSRRNQERILFILMGLIIIGLIAAGYFIFVEKLLPGFSEAVGVKEPIKAAVAQTQKETPKQSDEPFIADEDAEVIRVYFAKKGSDLLAFEQHRVRKNTVPAAQAKQVIDTLLKQPTNGKLYKILPEGTKLRGLFYDGMAFTVDLSLEFEKIFDLGATEQILAVYSIVNSLAELNPNASTRFLINGSEPKNDKSSVDMLANMTRLSEITE